MAEMITIGLFPPLWRPFLLVSAGEPGSREEGVTVR